VLDRLLTLTASIIAYGVCHFEHKASP